MITWTKLLDFYPEEQRGFINAFIDSYKLHYGGTDFGMFSNKSQIKLEGEISNIIAEEANDIQVTTFLFQITNYLHEKAQNAGDFTEYKALFLSVDQPFIEDLEHYYTDAQISYDILRQTDYESVLTNASTLAALTFPYTFWENFVRSLKLHIEKLKENESVEVETDDFILGFTLEEQESAKYFLSALALSDEYFTVYSLAKENLAALILQLKAIPNDNEAYAALVSLFLDKLYQTYGANVSQEAFVNAFAMAFSDDLRDGMVALLNEILNVSGASSYRVLAEEITSDLVLTVIQNQTIDAVFFNSLSQWLINSSQNYLLKTGRETAPFEPVRKEVTGKLTSEFTDKLANYLVKIYDTETGVLLDQAITQTFGLFRFSYLPAFNELEGGEIEYLDKHVKFEIENLIHPEIIINPIFEIVDAEKSSIVLSTTITEFELQSKQIYEIKNVVELPETGDVATFLNAINFETIRINGSVLNISGASVLENQPDLVEILDAHARLNLFSDDVQLNENARAMGYDSIDKINALTREEFVAEYVEQYSSATAPELKSELYLESARLHQQASVAGAFSGMIDILARSAEASNYNAGSGITGGSTIASSQKCSCEGCQTAVSPSAYLSALIAYTQANVRKSVGGLQLPLLINSLKDLFHQPFSELANYCQAATEKYVCQVRVAVETIRNYMKTAGQTDLTQTEKLPYLIAVYETLLSSLGTSTAEIQEALLPDNITKLNKLGEKLGLGINFITDKLFVEPSALTEEKIELLFGLQDTTRSPFNTGVKLNDTSLVNWSFRGMQWLKNTDENGFIYFRKNADTLEVYKAASSTEEKHLVAQGVLTPMTLSGPQRYVDIHPVNGSELYGKLQISDIGNFSINTNNTKISLIPEVTAERLKYQQAGWIQEADPERHSAIEAVKKSFIIDPDVIGPDDMRDISTAGSDGEIVYEIWTNRRNWLDAAFTTLATAADLTSMVNLLVDSSLYLNYGALPVNWVIPQGTTALTTIQKLYKDYQDKPTDKEVLATIQEGDAALNVTGLGFSIASFVRLNELLAKPANSLVEGELEEAAHILIQVLKQKSVKQIWIDEEAALNFSVLSPVIFHAPINEPTEGKWNIKPVNTFNVDKTLTVIPFVDPDLITIKDLPDPAYGGTYIALWNARKLELIKRSEELLEARGNGDFNAKLSNILVEAYGSNPALPSEFNNLEDIALALNYPDTEPDSTYAKAAEYVGDLLFLTQEEFLKLMPYIQKGEAITEKEWKALASILTTGWKRSIAYRGNTDLNYTSWSDPEKQANVAPSYWQVYKQRLVKWRASTEQRNNWTEAIQVLNSSPVIDPDQLADGDFVHPEIDENGIAQFNPAYALYASRVNTVNDWKAELNSLTWEAKINSFIFSNTTTDTAADQELNELFEVSKSNIDISSRLRQLKLSKVALEYIGNNKAKYTTSTSVKEDIDNILIQCRKEHTYSVWREEEAAAGIVISNLYFKIAFNANSEQNEYSRSVMVPWRSSRAKRQEWEDQLRARIEQGNYLVAQLEQAVEDAESDYLRILRDALIEYKINNGNVYASVEDKAKWLSDQLLIDFSVNCCQKTTRLAQAIEVLQKMYFLIRNGEDVFSNTQLTITNLDIEKDWKWLGSYESWRSLMFVYLYPENLLQPSFKPLQTDKFREIVQQTRQNLKLTPQDACHFMHEYEAYMQDIGSLQLQAACQTYTTSYRDGCAVSETINNQQLNFQFALAKSKQVYWNTYNAFVDAQNNVSSWQAVPGLENIDRVLNASPFTTENGERYLYVFAIINKDDAKGSDDKNLVAARYNLKTLSWEEALLELDLPDDVLFDQVIVDERKNESLIPVISGLRAKTKATWNDYEGEHPIPTENYNHILFSITLNAEGTKLDEKNTQESNLSYLYKVKLLTAIRLEDNSVHYFFSCRESVMATTQLCFFEIKPDVKIDTIYPPDYDRIMACIPEDTNPGSWYQRLYHYFDLVTDGYQDNKKNNANWLKKVVDIGKGEELSFKGIISNDVNSGKSYHLFFENRRRFGISFSSIIRPFVKCEVILPPNLYESSVGFKVITSNTFTDLSNNLSLQDTASGQSGYIGPCFQYPQNIAPTFYWVPNLRIYEKPEPTGRMIYIADNSITVPLMPVLKDAPALLTKTDASSQNTRKQAIEAIFRVKNISAPKGLLAYFEEAYYYLPLHLAQELQKNKHYEEALRYYRLVYDFQLPLNNRKISYVLTRDENIGSSNDLYNTAMSWLDNPDNPHSIAALRKNAYTRFTLMNIVRCLTEFADQEFTRDTAESVPRAKELYELAEELLSFELSTFEFQSCEAIMSQVDILVTDLRWKPEWERLKEMLRRFGLKNEVITLLEGTANAPEISIIGIFSDDNLTWEDRIEQAEALIEARMLALPNAYTNINAPEPIGNVPVYERLGYTPETADKAVQLLSRQAGEQFNDAVNTITAGLITDDLEWLGSDDLDYEVMPYDPPIDQGSVQVRPLMQLQLSGTAGMPYVPFLGANFCVPNNPVPHSLFLYVQLNLFKIRNCMNIAGMKRELDPYAAPTDATSGMPMIGANGRITYPGNLVVPATQYRYSVLVERTKQLVSIAQQVEGALLSALEKRDAEYYSKLKARQDIQTGKATVKLQDLRVTEAEDGIELAKRQLSRTQITLNTYNDWLDEGMIGWEIAMIIAYGAAGVVGAFSNTPAGYAGALNAAGQIASIYASQERREEEWNFQKRLAEQDMLIGDQQIKLSEDRKRITVQERAISELQLNHAEDTANFLMSKFTNAELYDWMSRVLEGVYNYFLQQATAMAKLAELQLAFERQENPAGMIQADYWTAPSENLSYDPDSAKPADRKGLTGSVRLLQDVTKLDQYAFETNKRKLQLTKTLSLSQLFPAEFALFRQTGRLPFSTLQTWFDRDFPGQYLRIIRRIKTSVIALVPPTDGIKAKLSTTGVSRVVVNGMQPQIAVLPRQPESVSYTSPMNATGLFEMEQQPNEFLYPFEGMGVEANWEFTMEPASNMMDFSTIADVLISIDYTALESYAHAKNVKDELNQNKKVRLERSFSFKNDFADQWFDLNHAEETAEPYYVRFELDRTHFPLNLKEIKAENISLLIDTSAEKTGLSLKLNKGTSGSGKNGTTNQYGLISTKTGISAGTSTYRIYSGDADSWGTFKKADPIGTWTLELNDPNLQLQLKEGKVNDLIFIVEFEGEGPAFN